MASRITNYKCPACTGPLHFVGASGRLECDYCGSSFELKEIEKIMAEEEAKAQESFRNEAEKEEKERLEAEEFAREMGEGAGTSDISGSAASSENTDKSGSTAGSEKAELWGQGMKSYNCPSCGAELVCEETTVATSCPYCGNPSIVPGQFAGMLRPDYIIPFKLDEDAAKAALKRHYRGKALLPKAFSAENRIQEIKGVYVPFWIFDGEADAKAEFDATRAGRVFRQGNLEVRETEHYHLRRGGRIPFRHIPADASTKMPDNYMDSIEPYDFEELKEFSSAYLPGFFANKYDVEAEDCAERISERAKNSALAVLESAVSGYDSVTMTGSAVELKSLEHRYAMLPVYLLATRWQGEEYLFAMNGQTGKLIGDLPVDNKRYWSWFFGIFAGVSLVMWMLLSMIL